MDIVSLLQEQKTTSSAEVMEQRAVIAQLENELTFMSDQLDSHCSLPTALNLLAKFPEVKKRLDKAKAEYFRRLESYKAKRDDDLNLLNSALYL